MVWMYVQKSVLILFTEKMNSFERKNCTISLSYSKKRTFQFYTCFVNIESWICLHIYQEKMEMLSLNDDKYAYVQIVGIYAYKRANSCMYYAHSYTLTLSSIIANMYELIMMVIATVIYLNWLHLCLCLHNMHYIVAKSVENKKQTE